MAIVTAPFAAAATAMTHTESLGFDQYFPGSASAATAKAIVEHNCPNCGANERLASVLQGDGPVVYVQPRKADGDKADSIPFAALDMYRNGQQAMPAPGNPAHLLHFREQMRTVAEHAARVGQVRQVDGRSILEGNATILQDVKAWLSAFDVSDVQVIAWTLGSPGHPPRENPQGIRTALDQLLVTGDASGVQSVRMIQRLGVDLAQEQENASFGEKSAARTLARSLGIPVIDGTEGLHVVDQPESATPDAATTVVGYIADAVRRREAQSARGAHEQTFVIKLNDGKGGDGNGKLVVPALTAAGSADPVARVREALSRLETFGAGAKKSPEAFLGAVEQVGTAVERWLEGGRSVSGKLNTVDVVGAAAAAAGDGAAPYRVYFLGSHEQLMRTADPLTHGGGVYPAFDDVHALVQEYSLRIGRALAEAGVRSEFGVDFLYHEGTLYVLEINLRRTGTTELDIQMATLGGHFDASGKYVAHVPATGREEVRVGMDVLVSQHERFKAAFYPARELRDLDTGARRVAHAPRPDRVIKALREAGLLYSPQTKTGVVPSFGNLSDGRIPMRMVAGSLGEAEHLYHRAVEALANAAGVPADERASIVQVTMPSATFASR